MLVQFLVENFRSFKDETVFSMQAPPGETRAVVGIPGHGLRLMRVAAFYGANASGKSNLVIAMNTARRLIAHEHSLDRKLPAQTFQLDPEAASKPCRFQFDFVLGEVRYSYVILFSTDAVIAEALYRRLPHASEEEMMYEREAPAEGGEHRVELGPLLHAGDEETRQFARFTARQAHVRQTLLTKFATGNVPGFAPIRDWFREGLTIIGASAAYTNLVSELHEDESLRHFFGEMLAKMGTGVREVHIVKERDAGLAQFIQKFEQVMRVPEAMEVVKSLLHGSTQKDLGIEIDNDGADVSVLRLSLLHSNRRGFATHFQLSDESDGTQRLLHLLPVLFHRTREAGMCTVIDELDRSLHTALTRHFVGEFLNMTSLTQSQLVFTTHDTNLLNGQLLPPRSIWFVEKDDDGASRIHSLSEYKPEQLDHLLEHLEEGYLQGRFGAIPFLSDRATLGWRSEEERSEA